MSKFRKGFNDVLIYDYNVWGWGSCWGISSNSLKMRYGLYGARVVGIIDSYRQFYWIDEWRNR